MVSIMDHHRALNLVRNTYHSLIIIHQCLTFTNYIYEENQIFDEDVDDCHDGGDRPADNGSGP